MRNLKCQENIYTKTASDKHNLRFLSLRERVRRSLNFLRQKIYKSPDRLFRSSFQELFDPNTGQGESNEPKEVLNSHFGLIYQTGKMGD